MAASAQVINEEARTGVISLRWIISARDDMVWFIGSVLTSYALLALYVSGVVPLVPMAAAWAILIDAPHVFGTFSRTYFDRTEWQARKSLLLWSLLSFEWWNRLFVDGELPPQRTLPRAMRPAPSS